MQLCFTRFCCVLCEWDRHTKDCHYSVKEWPKHEQFQHGQKHVRNEPLVHKKKIFLPPLHTNLDIMKNSVKAVDHDGKAFKYLLQKFLQISESKIKEGIYVGYQIKDLMNAKNFVALLKWTEKAV
jgi:hypothetical protein